MEPTKKILNIAIAVSIVTLSVSAFVYSVKENKAVASPQSPTNEFKPVGVFTKEGKDNLGDKRTFIYVVGYNSSTKEIKKLASTAF